MSKINTPALNYKVYYMKNSEKIIYSLLAFAVGAAVGYLFYGGIGKDEYGNPTTVTYVLDILIPGIVGLITAKMFIPIRTKQIIEKRRKQLTSQFRDMLSGLTTALGTGSNVIDSFISVRQDMRVQYEEDAYILNELDIIILGVENNNSIEDLIYDFGIRSGIEDIKDFSDVFRITYRKGGNFKEIIKNTNEILGDKLEINEEIETTVSGSKMEQKMMIAMPILLVGIIKMLSTDFAANFVTPAGIAATTIGIIMFIVSYFVARKVLDIKV
ncbi:type II secretion system F family protein [uncultured Eubacterium sp.]|uniref:type II secretion system F family protein n=1 Tax=uncultured Eubacterium sp. TaxID=165185 RepID=UPI002593FDEA|nr:hypothetical protein [uncultured Eubacterium sp.]